jgi:hypothetical protein
LPAEEGRAGRERSDTGADYRGIAASNRVAKLHEP